jgi:hypothetical protein
MRPTLLGARTIAAGLLALALSASVFGLSSRVFVSPLGKDSATCGAFASPCKTLAAAHTQVAPGGTVIVLYSGEFGPVTITKSVTIEAPTGLTAMVQTSAAAVTINAGSGDVVSLRGLVLTNAGTTHAGQGVLINSAKAVHIENCALSGFVDAVLAYAWPSGRLFVTGTTARNNDQGIRASSSSGEVEISVDHCVFDSNNNGILVQDGTRTAVRETAASGNINGILGQAATGTVDLTVAGCLVTHNTSYGVLSEADSGGSSIVRVAGSTVTGNSTGLASLLFSGSASMLSRGDNTVEGNTTNTSGVGTYSAK